MKNLINVFRGQPATNEENVFEAIARQANIDAHTVQKVLQASYQITQDFNSEIIDKQEDLYNTMVSQNRIQQAKINKIAKGLEEEKKYKKITNMHLKELQEEITKKAKKAAKGTNQMDAEDILFKGLTMDELFKLQEKQANETKQFRKTVGKYKRRIWDLVKLHMNDVYGTSKKRRKEDFQDYMFDEMHDYIKSISVYEIRKTNEI